MKEEWARAHKEYAEKEEARFEWAKRAMVERFKYLLPDFVVIEPYNDIAVKIVYETNLGTVRIVLDEPRPLVVNWNLLGTYAQGTIYCRDPSELFPQLLGLRGLIESYTRT